jgi:surface protein
MLKMCCDCSALKSIPLFNTNKVTNMDAAFANCYSVQYGASALFTQASTQENPPSSHQYAFSACGINTTQGAAELAQIPNDWK